MDRIYASPGVMSDLRSPTLHFWYREESKGVLVRLCDGDRPLTDGTPTFVDGCELVCDECIDTYVVDLRCGNKQIQIPLDYQHRVVPK